MARRVVNIETGSHPQSNQQRARQHAERVRAPLREVAMTLQEVLSRQVAAYAIGVRDAKTINRWANGETDTVRDVRVERRLRATYDIISMLLEVDAPATIRTWFVSMNPLLDDRTPVEAIRSGDEREAMLAARAFAAYG